MDPDWNITYINPLGAQILAPLLSDEDPPLIGRGFWDLFPDVIGSQIELTYRRAMETQTPARMEFHDALLSQWFDVRAYPSRSGGLAIYFLDVTDRHRALDALERSESRYRQLFDSIEDGFCIVRMSYDAHGTPINDTMTECNPAFAEATGLHDAVGRTVLELVPDIEPSWIERYGRVALTGEPLRFENEVSAWGRWFDVYAFRFGPPENHEVAIFFKNITQRKRADAALRASEERFRQLADAMPQLVWTADAQGELDYFNGRSIDFAGLVLRKSGLYEWSLAIHPDDLERTQREWAQARATVDVYTCEHRIQMADGAYRWFLSRAKPVGSGKSLRWFGTATDIDEVKRAHVAMTESERRFRLMAEGLPAIVWVHDAHGQQEYVNRTFADFFDADIGSFVGDAWQELAHPDDRDEYVRRFDEAIRTHQPFTASVRVRRGDGQWRWMESYGRPRFSGAGEFLGMVGASLDVTERQQAQAQLELARDELERANKAKDEFLAALSHELRTPLAPALLTLDMLLQQDGFSEQVRGDLTSVRHHVALETRLIDDLLDLTRVTRGKVNLQLEPCDLHTLVQQAIHTCCDEAFQSKGIALSLQMQAREHTVHADPTRLSQVLWNLLRNAIKFTPANGTIRLQTSHPGPGHVQIDVADSGVGIALQTLPTIFNAFEQGGQTITRRFGGLGMGLAIAKKMVELHGGEITAHSEGLGRGSRFTVLLPVLASSKPAGRDPTTQRPANSGETNSKSKARVLLVEDYAAMRRVLRQAPGQAHQRRSAPRRRPRHPPATRRKGRP